MNHGLTMEQIDTEWVIVRKFLERKPDDISTPEGLFFSIKHMCCIECKIILIKIYQKDFEYLKSNYNKIIDPLIKNMCFVTALIFSNSIDMIKFIIINYGINKKSIGIETYHDYMYNGLIYNPNLPIIKFIVEKMEFDTSYVNRRIYDICEKNPNVKIIKYLLKYISIKNSDILYFLKYAIKNSNIDIFEYFISKIKRDVNYDWCIIDDIIQKIQKSQNHILLMKILLENTNLVIEKNLPTLVRYYVNSEDNIIYIPFIVDYELFQLYIEKLINMYEMKPNEIENIVNKLTGINKLMFGNKICKFLKITYAFDETFETFVSLVDNLTNVIPLQTVKSIKQNNKRKRTDFSDIIPLFEHNNIKYYGNRVVHKSMFLTKEIIDECDIIDITLSIGAPKYIVNLYIDAIQNDTFDINDIQLEDFNQFLKFIDAYPSGCINIEKLQFEIINYLEKNYLNIDDYIKNICMKYKLKNMYLYSRNCHIKKENLIKN